MKRGILGVLVLLGQFAWGAKIIGNAGYIYDCSAVNQRAPYILMDYWEAEREWSLDLADPAPRGDYLKKVEGLIARTEKRFPLLGDLLRADLKLFKERRHDISANETLGPPEPSYAEVKPTGCLEVPIASNRFWSDLPRDPLFRIDARYFERLPQFHKAGLVFHELLRRRAGEYGLENPRSVRYMVALISSRQFTSATEYELATAFQQARLFAFQIGNAVFPLFQGGNCIGTESSDCERRSFTPATVGFDADGRIRAVLYAEGREEMVGLSDKRSRFWLRTSRLEFRDEAGLEKLLIKGMGVANPPKLNRKTHGFVVDVDGEFDVKSGRFKGLRKPVSPDVRGAGDGHFDGPISDLYKGLSYSVKPPPLSQR